MPELRLFHTVIMDLLGMQTFPSFEYEADKINAGPRWNKWVDRLENYFIAMNIDEDGRKRALLLHYAGERVYDIYQAEKGDTDPDYAHTVRVLKDYFTPQIDVEMEIYHFRNCKQKDGQTIDEYVTELRQMAKNCEFTDLEKQIVLQIIQHCKSGRLRRRAFREKDKGLTNILSIARALECSDRQAATIERDNTTDTHSTVNALKSKQQQQRPRNQYHPPPQRNFAKSPRKTHQSGGKLCIYCAEPLPHSGPCPAQGKTCNYCKKKNHIVKACIKLKKKEAAGHRGVRHISEQQSTATQDDTSNTCYSDSSDDDYVYRISTVNMVQDKAPVIDVCLNNKKVNILVDTGASVNILDELTYKNIGKPTLSTETVPQLYPYGSSKSLRVMGQCHIPVKTKQVTQQHIFYVVQGSNGSLLSYATAQDLGIVKIINSITDPVLKYPQLFQGVGKLKDVQVKLHIDNSVVPVAHKHRRVPFHLRTKVTEDLQRQLDADLIERVEGQPTPWVSPIVTPPKKEPGSIRVCVDMRSPNKAIQRERHRMPTIDEIITDLNGATVFSKLDLRSGYHQLELHPDSRYITTFSTHMGLFQYKRLNFGISSASEIFQETICNVIRDIDGAKNISDDIIIYGKTQADHDKALDATLRRLSDKGLTLNKEKCHFNQDKVDFYGLVFSSSGISPDPKKVSAIKDIAQPRNVSEVKSFLGMMNYCARFVKDYATLSEPLRRLTKEKTEWVWGIEQNTAFQKLKDSLTSDTVMAYFDPTKPIEIFVDASPFGLGAMLVQSHKVISYASRALTDVESRYSQTEREALAVVWACEHFDMYVNGANHFTVITDHKPLEKIWQKPRPPLRIERWGLRLQPYKFTILYKPGSENPSDYMSRHPPEDIISKTSQQQKIAEQFVKFVSHSSVPNAMQYDEIKNATARDKTLQKVIELHNSGRWFEIKFLQDSELNFDEIQEFNNISDELTVSDGVLLRGHLIVIPEELRDKAVSLAHEGHQGMSRTKSFLRSKIWFPGINNRVETAIRNCVACQACTYSNTKTMEPLKMSPMPSKAWQNLSADFMGPLPTGDYLFVITDEHSRYPVVEIVKSTSASCVIPVLDKVISQFGIPETIKTDNGSPFNSYAFAQFAKHTGFKHRRITPLWPRANAQAEACNKPLMKAIRAAYVESKNWKQELFRFLRQYRVTPHPTTGFSPYVLLFGREPHTKIPHISVPISHESVSRKAMQNDMVAKSKMKMYADKRNHASPCDINVGDYVLIRQKKQDKLTTPYNPQPFLVTTRQGSMLTASSGDKSVTRNSSYFKKIPCTTSEPIRDEEEIILPQSVIPQAVHDDMNNDMPNEQNTNEESDGVPKPIPIPNRPVREKRKPKYLSDYV